ncbi:hypothetical protein Taro_021779, partial [Colocasia esculenta]|nr:hypothetical protein [Colocasia esculenta]
FEVWCWLAGAFWWVFLEQRLGHSGGVKVFPGSPSVFLGGGFPRIVLFASDRCPYHGCLIFVLVVATLFV